MTTNANWMSMGEFVTKTFPITSRKDCLMSLSYTLLWPKPWWLSEETEFRSYQPPNDILFIFICTHVCAYDVHELICVCVCVLVWTHACGQRSEDNFKHWSLPFTSFEAGSLCIWLWQQAHWLMRFLGLSSLYLLTGLTNVLPHQVLWGCLGLIQAQDCASGALSIELSSHSTSDFFLTGMEVNLEKKN